VFIPACSVSRRQGPGPARHDQNEAVRKASVSKSLMRIFILHAPYGPLIQIFLEAGEDRADVFGRPRSATASAMELLYLRRNKGVSFSWSSSSTPTDT